MFSWILAAFPPDASGSSCHIKRHAGKLSHSAVISNCYPIMRMGQIQKNSIALHSLKAKLPASANFKKNE